MWWCKTCGKRQRHWLPSGRMSLAPSSGLRSRGAAIGTMPSRELRQQRSGFLQIYGVQPPAEPGIALWQELACGIALALLLPEATQAHGGAQFQRLRLL